MARIEELFSELDKGVENLKTAQKQLKVYRQAILKHAFEGKLTAQWREENKDLLESPETLNKRIQLERNKQYAQQHLEWESNGKQSSKPGMLKSPLKLSTEQLATLPMLPASWSWARVEEFAEKVTDGEHITPKRVKDGFYLLSARNIQNGYLSLFDVDYVPIDEYNRIRKRCNPQAGDILISCSGSVGRVCRVPEGIDFVMVRSVALIKIQYLKKTSKFYEYLFQSPVLQKQIESGKKATAQANLFLEPIKNLRIILCSDAEKIEIIKELETCLSVIDQMEKIINNSLQKSASLRQAILKKAFSGQLVPQDPNDEPASILLERIRSSRKNKNHQ